MRREGLSLHSSIPAKSLRAEHKQHTREERTATEAMSAYTYAAAPHRGWERGEGERMARRAVDEKPDIGGIFRLVREVLLLKLA